MNTSRQPEPFVEWIIAIRDPREAIQDNPWFVSTEVLFIVFGMLLLKHAIREGGRHVFLWTTVVLYALITEAISTHPVIDCFWHSQAIVMLMGRRIPLYILFVYSSFLYTSMVAVSHLKIPWWAQPFAVGLSGLIFDLPFDIMCVKNVFWTWHDTDPNLEERHFYMPWSNYNFQLVFNSAFCILFTGLHKLLTGNSSMFESAGFVKELICVMITVLLSFPLGVVFTAVYYDPLHLYFGLHGEECILCLAAVYGSIVWAVDRRTKTDDKKTNETVKGLFLDEILAVITLHYLFFITMAIFSKPENLRSTSFREPVGPCNETTKFTSITTGKILQKRKYLCLTDYDEPYDFHCVKDEPKSGDHWYTICGTAYPIRAEYVLITCTAGILGITWFWQLMKTSTGVSRKPKIRPSEKTKIS